MYEIFQSEIVKVAVEVWNISSLMSFVCFIFSWTNLVERVDTYETAGRRRKHEMRVTFAKLVQLAISVIAEPEMLLV